MLVNLSHLSLFLTGLFTVKRSSGPTPAPSEHPSRPSFEDAIMKEGTLGHHRTAQAHVCSYTNSSIDHTL